VPKRWKSCEYDAASVDSELSKFMICKAHARASTAEETCPRLHRTNVIFHLCHLCAAECAIARRKQQHCVQAPMNPTLIPVCDSCVGSGSGSVTVANIPHRFSLPRVRKPTARCRTFLDAFPRIRHRNAHCDVGAVARRLRPRHIALRSVAHALKRHAVRTDGAVLFDAATA